MAKWKRCVKADGSDIVVNLDLATTIVRLKDRTRIVFDNNNTVEVQDDLTAFLDDTSETGQADRT